VKKLLADPRRLFSAVQRDFSALVAIFLACKNARKVIMQLGVRW
jgi:hypothetical protein